MAEAEWSETEKQLLLDLRDRDRSFGLIAKILGRSEAACEREWLALAAANKPSPASAIIENKPPARFVVRKGSVEGSWMVWDRQTRRPAKTLKGIAAGLTEQQARDRCTELAGD